MGKTSSNNNRKTSKSKIRLFLAFVICSGITVVLGYNLFTNIIGINNMLKEKKDLNSQIVKLEDEKKTLESDIMKLENPDYIARYVREKYFYSKEGEVILRIED